MDSFTVHLPQFSAVSYDGEVMSIDIHTILDGKWEDGTRPKDLYVQHISKDPKTFVEPIMEGLRHRRRKVQGGCAELASLLSEDRPELVYSYIDRFIEGLSAREPILRWEAACTLGNLAAVDSKRKKLPPCVPKLTSLLSHESIVLKGHAVRALGKVARAHPAEAEGILDALIAARESFPGNKAGILVETMAAFDTDRELKAKAQAFVEPFVKSDVASVSKKAKRALKLLRG